MVKADRIVLEQLISKNLSTHNMLQ